MRALLCVLGFLSLIPSAMAQDVGSEFVGSAALQQDPRLSKRLYLNSPGIPLGKVVKDLGRRVGVQLTADSRVGDELLISHVPSAPASEIMTSVADLYRLSWRQTITKNGPTYRLSKSSKQEREEARLRQQAFDAALQELAKRLQSPPTPLANSPTPVKESYALRAVVYPLLARGLDELAREGAVAISVRGLPMQERESITRCLVPVLQRMDDEERSRRALIAASAAKQGMPLSEELTADPGPPETPDGCEFLAEVRPLDTMQLWVGWHTARGAISTWETIRVTGDEEATALYADKGMPGNEPELTTASADAPAEAFARRVFGPFPRTSSDDVPPALARIAEESGIGVYSDCYTVYGLLGSRPIPTNSVPPGMTAQQGLNAYCRPTPGRFWWRRGDSAMIRSRNWLWKSQTVMSANLVSALVQSFDAKQQANPATLAELGHLPMLQALPLFLTPGHSTTWRRGIQVPGRLSVQARESLHLGIDQETLNPQDRAQISLLLPHPRMTLPKYAARVQISRGYLADEATHGAVVTIKVATNQGADVATAYIPITGAIVRNYVLAEAK